LQGYISYHQTDKILLIDPPRPGNVANINEFINCNLTSNELLSTAFTISA
jgi:hypothetical protein